MTPEIVAVITTSVAVLALILTVLQRFGLVPVKANGNGKHKEPPSGSSLPPPRPKRSEQLAQAGPEWMSDTQRNLPPATSVLRCDRHQALEDAVAELASAARETRATNQLRFDQIDARLDSHHSVLAEVRDSQLRLEAHNDNRPVPYRVGVVRGGAAR